jgi:hypothetical protein
MLVQPQQAATVCELDLVQHSIGAQTLDPIQNLGRALDGKMSSVSVNMMRRDAREAVAYLARN